jgi:hypothetical protein
MLSCKLQIQHMIECAAEPQSTMYDIPPLAHKSQISMKIPDENQNFGRTKIKWYLTEYYMEMYMGNGNRNYA